MSADAAAQPKLLASVSTASRPSSKSVTSQDMSAILRKYAPKPFYGCTVALTIHSGENLIAMDQTMFNKDGKSDPFVKVNVRKKESSSYQTVYKTTVVKSTLNPVWKDATFNVRLQADHEPTLTFDIWDYDMASANDEMGRVVVNLLDHPENKRKDDWFAVQPSPDCLNPTGRLRISFSYNLLPPPLDFDAVTSSALRDEAFMGGFVSLEIVKGTDLVAMDSSLFSKKGSSDPYVKVMVSDSVTKKKSAVAKTAVVKKSLNPAFKSRHDFVVTRHNSPYLCLQVYDWDAISGDDPMGQVVLSLRDFLAPEDILVPPNGDYRSPMKFSPDHEHTFACAPMSGCPNPTGTLTVKVLFRPMPPDPHVGKAFRGGLLLGTVVRATNLLAVDRNVLVKNSSDPFVLVTCHVNHPVNVDEKKKQIIHKTPHKTRNLNPEYNSKFVVNLFPAHDSNIEFEIMDYDTFSSPDPMGHCVLNMHDVRLPDPSNPLLEQEFNLPVLPITGCPNPTGTLTVSVRFVPLPETRPFWGGDLKLTIMSGEDLCAMDASLLTRKATSSDPYVRVAAPLPAKNYKLEVLGKTPVVKTSLNPKWNSSFLFAMTQDHSPLLHLLLYDYDVTSGDDPMGQVIINLEDESALGNGEPVWKDVLPCTGCLIATGKIRIRGEFIRTPTPRYEDFWGGFLSMRIMSGENLIAMDTEMFSSGKSDPYVKLQGFKKSAKLEGKQKPEIFGKTEIKYKTLNPRWNHKVSLSLTAQHDSVISLAIFDYDTMSGDDPMGKVDINLNEFAGVEDQNDLWFDVQPCVGCKNPTGRLHVIFTWAAEFSPEEKARRKEEARRKLFEKAGEPDRSYTIEMAMEDAEKKLKELDDLRDGQYYHEEVKEKTEFEKLIDKYGSIGEAIKAQREEEKAHMSQKERNKLYLTDFEREPVKKPVGGRTMSMFAKAATPGSGGLLDAMSLLKLGRKGGPDGEHDNEEEEEEEYNDIDETEDDPLSDLSRPKATETKDDAATIEKNKRTFDLLGPVTKGPRAMSMIVASGKKGIEQASAIFSKFSNKTLKELDDGTLELPEVPTPKDEANKAPSTGEEKKEVAISLLRSETLSLLSAAGRPRSAGGVRPSSADGGGGSASKEGGVKLAKLFNPKKAAVDAALGNEHFAKKKIDVTPTIVGAASQAIAEAHGGPPALRPETPKVKVTKYISLKARKEKEFADKKQQYQRLIRGVEARFYKKHRSSVAITQSETIVPRNPIHAMNILNAAARDEPIKYLAEDLAAAEKRAAAAASAYTSNFTKFKPLFSHPLPTSLPRFDCENMMKRLNNLPRPKRCAAAAAWGLSWCIEELYMMGCPVSTENSTGFTPLHIAARFDYVDCCEVLLNIGLEPSSGVDVNAETRSYLTPLAVALANGSAETAKLLMSRGGVEVIPRPIEGFRTILDIEAPHKYPWAGKDATNQLPDYTLARPIRAVDDIAKELKREAYLGQF